MEMTHSRRGKTPLVDYADIRRPCGKWHNGRSRPTLHSRSSRSAFHGRGWRTTSSGAANITAYEEAVLLRCVARQVTSGRTLRHGLSIFCEYIMLFWLASDDTTYLRETTTHHCNHTLIGRAHPLLAFILRRREIPR